MKLNKLLEVKQELIIIMEQLKWSSKDKYRTAEFMREDGKVLLRIRQGGGQGIRFDLDEVKALNKWLIELLKAEDQPYELNKLITEASRKIKKEQTS